MTDRCASASVVGEGKPSICVKPQHAVSRLFANCEQRRLAQKRSIGRPRSQCFARFDGVTTPACCSCPPSMEHMRALCVCDTAELSSQRVGAAQTPCSIQYPSQTPRVCCCHWQQQPANTQQTIGPGQAKSSGTICRLVECRAMARQFPLGVIATTGIDVV